MRVSGPRQRALVEKAVFSSGLNRKRACRDPGSEKDKSAVRCFLSRFPGWSSGTLGRKEDSVE